MTMEAVGRAAQGIVVEVRRQFREITGLMEGTAEPDYASCVDICTKSAQKEMIMPAILAVVVPIVVGLILGVAGVAGMLAGATVSGFILAVMMANSGGAWDNAKNILKLENMVERAVMLIKRQLSAILSATRLKTPLARRSIF